MSHNMDGADIHISPNNIQTIKVNYPGNERYDCEAMAVDPSNGDILLFTKDHRHRQSRVYKVPHGSGYTKTLEYVSTLPHRQITGTDFHCKYK